MRQHPGEEGVSELVGAMLLLGLTVIGVALVGIVFLSGPQPDEIPRAAIAAGVNETSHLVLIHEGGDPLRTGEYRIYVDTGSGLVDGTNTFTGLKDGAWSVGGNLVHNGPGTPTRVIVTAVSGGSETILAEPEFQGGADRFSPDPVGPGVTPVGTVTPAPTPADIVSIDLPEEIPAKDAEIFATITSNQTEYVHMILYNYDMLSNNEGTEKAKLEGLVMTQTEIEDIFTSGVLKITDLGNLGDTIAVVVIAYDENNTPIASITEIGTLQW